jgi:hypothetical protein
MSNKSEHRRDLRDSYRPREYRLRLSSGRSRRLHDDEVEDLFLDHIFRLLEDGPPDVPEETNNLPD